MIQVALVGYGLSGQTIQAPFFSQNSYFQIRRIVTRNQNPCLRFPNCIHTRELEEALEDSHIDLVSITTPDETHYPYAVKALEAGKHVLVEKPFASSPAEAKALFALARQKERQVFAFQNRRFDSDFRTIRAIVDSGVLGRLVRYEAHYNRLSTGPHSKPWKEQVTPSSGILYGLGTHILDQALALFGKPAGFWGKTYIQRKGSLVDDAFDLHLDYGACQVFLGSGMFVREETPRYILHGENGSFIKYGIDPQEDHLKAGLMPGTPGFGKEDSKHAGILHVHNGHFTVRGHVESHVGDWSLLFESLARAIREGTQYVIPEADVLEQLLILSTVHGRG